MFEESLVESTALLRTRNRWPVIASVSAQLAVLAVIVYIPLVHPEIVPFHAAKLQSLAPPPVPKPIPPPQPQRVQATSSPSAPTAPTPAQPRLQTLLSPDNSPPVDAPALTPGTLIASLGTGLPPGLGIPGPASPNVTVAPNTTAKPNAKPSRVSVGVTEGLLINPIKPVYPPIARATHTEGTVIIHAIISKSGMIERATVVSGNAMLTQAALDAVRTARYRPYLLNNEPTEVETTISINFRLGS